MSTDKRYLLSRVEAGSGPVLDLGGSGGALREPLEALGYSYVNVDLNASGTRAVRGDAHRLPFHSQEFSLVVSKDTLEHFIDPIEAMREARRVLKPDGRLVIWVPFLCPFHATDYFRFTPIGLRAVADAAGLEILEISAPLWVCSVTAQAPVILLARLGLGRAGLLLERFAAWLDERLIRFQGSDLGFAYGYVVVTRPSSASMPATADTAST